MVTESSGWKRAEEERNGPGKGQGRGESKGESKTDGESEFSEISESSEIHEAIPELRLHKVLAQAGVASRRQAERLILEGRVTVNGRQVSVLGMKVGPQDRIQVDGALVTEAEGQAYYLLHKPVGVITSARDPQGRKTVLELMEGVPQRVYPVGRLDYDTSGLLLLVNDGALAHRLTHPSYGIEKTYRVWVQGPVHNRDLESLRRGVVLTDGKTAPAQVEVCRESEEQLPATVLQVTIHEGRNRQIRRMLAAVGYPVLKLARIQFGNIVLEATLPPGAYRALTSEEIKGLRAGVGL